MNNGYIWCRKRTPPSHRGPIKMATQDCWGSLWAVAQAPFNLALEIRHHERWNIGHRCPQCLKMCWCAKMCAGGHNSSKGGGECGPVFANSLQKVPIDNKGQNNTPHPAHRGVNCLLWLMILTVVRRTVSEKKPVARVKSSTCLLWLPSICSGG